MPWPMLVQLMNLRGMIDNELGRRMAIGGPGCVEAITGREIAARAALQDDAETRAFLAGVAEVVALV